MKIDSFWYSYTQFLIICVSLKVSPAFLETVTKPEETISFVAKFRELEDDILKNGNREWKMKRTFRLTFLLLF